MKVLSSLKKLTDKKFFSKLANDGILEMASSLSFYTALSLAPLLILFLTLISVINDDIREALVTQVQGLAGDSAADLIGQIVDNVQGKSHLRDWASFLGLITLLISAGAIFGNLRASLNKIFEVKPKDKDAATKSLWVKLTKVLEAKFFNMAMVLVFVLLSIGSLVVSSALSMLLKGSDAIIGQIISVVSSLFIFGVVFAAIYYFLPQTKISKKVALTSGLITAVMFTIGKELIGLYMGTSAMASPYGAAGSLIALLVWVYYSSAVIFLSAEIAHEVATD